MVKMPLRSLGKSLGFVDSSCAFNNRSKGWALKACIDDPHVKRDECDLWLGGSMTWALVTKEVAEVG